MLVSCLSRFGALAFVCLLLLGACASTAVNPRTPLEPQFDAFASRFSFVKLPFYLSPTQLDTKRALRNRIPHPQVRAYLEPVLRSDLDRLYAPAEAYRAPMVAVARLPEHPTYTALITQIGLPDWYYYGLVTFTPEGRVIDRMHLANAPSPLAPFRSATIFSNRVIEVVDNIPVTSETGYLPPNRSYFVILDSGHIVPTAVVGVGASTNQVARRVPK